MEINIKNTTLVSPKSYLRSCYSKPKQIKNKKKIPIQNFRIPLYNEYELLTIYNYKVKELREICSHYKIKKSGNKDELTYNIYNFLKYSYYIVKIQRQSRGYLQRLYNKLHGPAFFNKKMCTNETDFYTLDPLTEIPYSQYISIEIEGLIYGYDIKSLYNLHKMNNGGKVTNPYNRDEFPIDTWLKIKRLIKLSKIIGETLDLKIDMDADIDKNKLEELHIISLFQEINELGNYSDSRWFQNLNTRQLIIFVRELYDIWNYRAQLSQQVKSRIYPNGNPFHFIDIARFQTFREDRIKYCATKLIENMIKQGIDHDSKCLGAYYVLAALTLVSSSARESLPWLYQSVAHIQ